MARRPQLEKTDNAKYHSPEAFAAECERMATLRGYARCEVAEFIRSLPRTGDDFADAGRAVVAVQQHPEFGARACGDGILFCRIGNTPEDAANIQMKSMRGLLEHPWTSVHFILDTLMQEPKMRFVSATALEEMLAHVRAHHERADEWMLRSWNRRHIPNDFHIAHGEHGHADAWPAHREAPFKG